MFYLMWVSKLLSPDCDRSAPLLWFLAKKMKKKKKSRKRKGKGKEKNKNNTLKNWEDEEDDLSKFRRAANSGRKIAERNGKAIQKLQCRKIKKKRRGKTRTLEEN
ncbi:hypothetical protein M0813_17164 [Anaeramoeba flamelloides]|uniref:Uncharacterized protein n=1 Tax=Anaeramoeba flamelloides TaxID=1746091 RepID=A0ABQ8YXU6_9EUKA|nr:hypothetical protein M0813_17164 [Anaeramoeba flamelloides]